MPDGSAEGFDEQGFVFYTNLDSQKGRELGDAPKGCSGVSLEELEPAGTAARIGAAVEDHLADAYFATPPAPHPDRRLGQQAVRGARKPDGLRKAGPPLHMAKFAVGTNPRPANWSATGCCRLIIEFCRIGPIGCTIASSFRRGGAGEPWSKTRLYP